MTPKERLLGMSVQELDTLSVRVTNSLQRANVSTIGQLTEMTMTDLLGIYGLGKKQAREITEMLARIDLSLKPDANKKSGKKYFEERISATKDKITYLKRTLTNWQERLRIYTENNPTQQP